MKKIVILAFILIGCSVEAEISSKREPTKTIPEKLQEFPHSSIYITEQDGYRFIVFETRAYGAPDDPNGVFAILHPDDQIRVLKAAQQGEPK